MIRLGLLTGGVLALGLAAWATWDTAELEKRADARPNLPAPQIQTAPQDCSTARIWTSETIHHCQEAPRFCTDWAGVCGADTRIWRNLRGAQAAL